MLDRTLTLCSVLGLLLLAGCGSWGRSYLDTAVGHANQDHVQSELGQPDRVVRIDNGQTRWIYRHCIAIEGCHVWYLTFDRHRVLQSWERAPEHL